MKKCIVVLSIVMGMMFSGPLYACLDVEHIYQEAEVCKDPSMLRILKWQTAMIEEEFPYTEQEAFEQLSQKFPNISTEVKQAWLHDDKMECVVIKGQRRYFANIVNNIFFRNLDLMRERTRKEGKSPFYDELRGIIFSPKGSGFKEKNWQALINPVAYLAELTLSVPRSELPDRGTLGLWVPLPIQTACQVNPRLVSVNLAEYIKTVPLMDGEIGYVYLEVPLGKLKDDLNLQVKFTFDHFQQRFRVDPDKVLDYDRQGRLYKTYTRSYGNITVTPEITAEAKRVAAGETNPYKIAQRLYDHIVANIYYSNVPHVTVAILDQPESVYVHENRYGDCGSQSMYFAAMCRSLGIPARCPGGYQLIPGREGTHFWAEFYLEGYGWVPVDTTVAEAASWSGLITEAQREAYEDYFFGNMDPYRYVVQKDVDILLNPRPKYNFMSGNRPFIVLQSPWMDCPDCETNPMSLVDKYYQIRFIPLYR